MASDQRALNALAKGAGITAIAMFFSKMLSYLYRIIVARLVGPEAYGQLSLAIMVVGFGGTFSLLALNSGLQKFIPEFRVNDEKAKIKGLVLGSLYISVPASLIVTITIFYGSEFIALELFESPGLVPVLKVMSVAPLFASLSKIFLDTTVAFNKIIYRAGTMKIIQNIVQLLVTLVLIILGLEVVGAAWGWIAGTIVAAILGFYFMERKVGPIIFSTANPEYQFKKILRYSSPLLLSGIIATVMGWADTALLGYFMADSEVGLYNAALPTALLILLPHQAIGSLALTSFSELKERKKENVEKSMQRATYWVFSLVFPTFLIMTLFSDQVLLVLFGSEYTIAGTALSILAVGYLFSASVGRVGSYLQAEGYTNYILYNNLIAIALNIGLNIAMIPVYGIIGAAIATASSTILANILMTYEVWKKEEVISLPFRKVFEITAVGLVPLLLVAGLDMVLFNNTPFWFIFPAGIIYYLLYAAVFLRFIGLEDEERKVFLRTGEKIGYRDEIESILTRVENAF